MTKVAFRAVYISKPIVSLSKKKRSLENYVATSVSTSIAIFMQGMR